METFQQDFQVVIDGQNVPVDIRMMRRKSMRLSVTDQGRIDLRIPVGCRQDDVSLFLHKHHAWLVERLQRADVVQLRRLSEFPHLGEILPIKRTAERSLVLDADELRVPEHWTDEQMLAAMDRWRRGFARKEFERHIDTWWPVFCQYGVARPVLRVKKMKTRWGSLSTRGYINLNLALTQVAPDLIELVVVHELCHIRYMNHGAGFQRLMSQHVPDWRQREQALDKIGRLLL